MIIRIFLLVLLLALIGGIWYAWNAFPIISGYGAKNLCSAIYLQHRKAADVIREDLGDFPLSLASFKVNEKNNSVTASVWGFAVKKAIFRPGLGCTLINELPEATIRAQRFLLPQPFAGNTENLPWPLGDKVIDSVDTGIDKSGLQKAINELMQPKTSFNGKTCYTRSVLVIHKGNIVAEKYAPGFDKNTVQLGWSVSKSLTAAMIGVLVKDGKIGIDAPAPVASWKNTDKEKITIRQLLQQCSGLSFEENYTKPCEVTNMLFKHGDMAAFTEALPLAHPPGAVFNYSSGNSNILSGIIRNTVGEKDYASFPYQGLFHRINMYSMLLEPDASGTYIGSSYSYATARDFARFGLLYYNNGQWNGEQILPANWVKESIQPAPADPRKHYGFQFWLNGYDEKDLTKRWLPDVPADMFFADGYGGQDIYIIPSKELLIVRLGLHNIDDNAFLKEVIASVNP